MGQLLVNLFDPANKIEKLYLRCLDNCLQQKFLFSKIEVVDAVGPETLNLVSPYEYEVIVLRICFFCLFPT